MDIKDKDPFANADAKPKDDISMFGFVFRGIIRYARIAVIFYVLGALFFYFVFGISVLDYLGF